jgi:hypothetical protein
MASLSSGEETTPWLTVAQALVKFLEAQYSESDGEEQKLSSATSTPRINPTSAQDLRRIQGHPEAVPVRRIGVVHDHDRYRAGLVGSLVSQRP